MGTQRLNAKSCRRIERATGQEVAFACASGGYAFEFVTTEHRHGWFDKKTGEWGWIENPTHFANGCAPWEHNRPDNSGGYRHP